MSGAEQLLLVGMVEEHRRADNSTVIGTLRNVSFPDCEITISQGNPEGSCTRPFHWIHPEAAFSLMLA